MKKLIVICATAIMAISSYGQGQVTFANSSTTLLTTNKNATGVSLASGNILGAGNYTVGMFYGPAGTTDPTALTPVGYAANSGTTGRFANSPLTAAGWAVGTPVVFQVRAWSTSVGADWATVSSKINADWVTKGYATELVNGTVGGQYFGYSTLGAVTLVTSPTPYPATFGTGAGQVGGFVLNEIHPVPEPSTIALGALGLMGVLFIRRRK